MIVDLPTPNNSQPGPYSEDELRKAWNSQADEHNQWDSLGLDEKLAWAQNQAMASGGWIVPSVEVVTQPPADGEVAELADELTWIAGRLAAIEWSEHSCIVTRAAELLKRLAPLQEPIMTADFRALCAELADALDNINCNYNVPNQSALVERALTALTLSQPLADGEVAEPVERLAPLQPTPVSERLPEADKLVPVGWCRTDEFQNAMKRGGSFNGWISPGAGMYKCDMRLYALPLPSAEVLP